MKKTLIAIALVFMIILFPLHPLSVTGQTSTTTSEIDHVWKLVEIVDFENLEGWDAQNTDTYWKFDHSYGQGNFSSRVWHKDDQNYVAYGAKASWSTPPKVMKSGEKISLNVNLAETENTHKNNASAAATWADFASPERGFTSRGDVPFANNDGVADVTINGANKSSASETVTAITPVGSPGSRIAIRQIYYMGTSMATYYIYEWQVSQSQLTQTKIPTTTTLAPSKTTPTTTKIPLNCVDSEARFAGLSGQVEVRPGNDEDAWDFAKMGMVLCCEDHIRTGPRSSAIIGFGDLSTFVMKADTEILLSTPPEKESKLDLVIGNIWVNVKKMAKDGTMEVTMNHAVSGIKGTTFICESTETTSTLKVIEGSVEFKDNIGKTVTVNSGEKVSATSNGMGAKETFDTALEEQQWEGLTPTSNSSKWGLIFGIVIAVIAILIIILWFVFRKRKLKLAN